MKKVNKPVRGRNKPAVKSASRVSSPKRGKTKSPAPSRHSSKTRKSIPTPKPTNKSTARIAPVAHTNGTHTKPASAKSATAPAIKSNILPKPSFSPATPNKLLPPKVEYKPIAPARIESVIPPEKDLSTGKGGKPGGGTTKDRIVLMVPDPFWLHTYWELSYQSVQRAEVALGQDWLGAKPIIRLFDVTSQDTTSTSETPLRDINVHGGCSHWYIDVPQPPRSYRADIGYLSRRGQFYVLARSNVVTPPKAGASETIDDASWAADIDDKSAERILAMSTGFESSGGPPQLKELFDEQFRKPLKDAAFGTGATLPGKLRKFFFDLDAELIVSGRTDPTASVTLQNEPVKLRPDGTFTMRFSLPDSRQIIPAVATATDGMEERTIVLAVERNTKHLDPMIHDLYGEP
ncbi:MAG TPA: DUF4912 domain-containing protein [Fimbriiglobus sp.]|jgi:hypothetical protein